VSVVTIGFGLALMALGAIGYLHNPDAPTALIPGYFGIGLCVLGFIGLCSDGLRKHVMHAAVLVSLIGFLMAAGRLVAVAISKGGLEATAAFWALLCMTLLCGAHVALCVKSFIDARRRRKQAGSPPTAQLPT
jgi:hypothetical protein